MHVLYRQSFKKNFRRKILNKSLYDFILKKNFIIYTYIHIILAFLFFLLKNIPLIQQQQQKIQNKIEDIFYLSLNMKIRFLNNFSILYFSISIIFF